ncbi:MAG: hypothetical protein ACREIC_28370 [Limisphaerales bacterium]
MHIHFAHAGVSAVPAISVERGSKRSNNSCNERHYKGGNDHTSVLKCIARRFGNGSYSKDVDDRPVGNIWDALELDEPRADDAFPPPPSDAGFTPGSEPEDEIPQAFAKAAAAAKASDPESTRQKFPELFSHFDNIG